jgi:hypothetical protein
MTGEVPPPGRGDDVATPGELRVTRGPGSRRRVAADSRGIDVDADGVAVRSGSVKIRAPRGPEAPVILRIAISGRVGSGHISVRQPRRTFWQRLQISEGVPHHLPDLPESAQRMAGQEVYVCRQEWLRGDLLISCPELGDVQVSYLVTGLSGRGVAGGLVRPFASFAAFPRLALLPFPVFLSARPRLVWVLFPCALLLGARARAPLLPDRQGNQFPVGERARCVAGTAA